MSILWYKMVYFVLRKQQEALAASEAAKKNAQNQLLEELEKDCDVIIYKAALREQKNGLRKLFFQSFLIEIQPNEKLNRIFKARTYLILSNIREKV